MSRGKRSQAIEEVRETLRTRGISPDKFVKTLLAFEDLMNSLKTHDEIEVAGKVVQTLAIAVTVKHNKFHAQGGQDERSSAEIN